MKLRSIVFVGLLVTLAACMTQPPVITVQPRSQTVIVGTAPAFSVTATGAEPLSYQWSKNGADISGATAATYAAPIAALSDSSAKFQVAVSNAGGSVKSCVATLTVIASGTASSSDPDCSSVSPPPAPPTSPTPPSPPAPPSPSPPSPPSPPTPPAPPTPPTPPTPPPNTPWTVPAKKWNATFKKTTVATDPGVNSTEVVEGTAVFIKDEPGTRAITAISGSFSVTKTTTRTGPNDCKLETDAGNGTIKINEGRLVFQPDDEFSPIQVQYTGQGGASFASVTTTYSNCPVAQPPRTLDIPYIWLLIPCDSIRSPKFYTTPDLISWSDKCVYSSIAGLRITYEWSFTKAN